MNDLLKLNNPVGPGEHEDQDDVMAVKSALQETGDLPAGQALDGWRNEAMNDAVKQVQTRNGLWRDGRMRPNGPTHRVVDAERKEKREGSKPQGLGLRGSVGPQAANDPTDVRKVQTGLGHLGYMQSQLTGIYDQPTRSGVHRFQMDYNLKDDGVAHREGETDRMMARVSAPLTASTAANSQPSTRRLPAAKPAQTRSIADRLGDAWDDVTDSATDLAGDIVGNVAEGALSTFSSVARGMGMQHDPDAVDHFLGGSGTDRRIPAAHTMGRHPVETGVQRNKQRFEDSFTTSRSKKSHLGGANPDQDYVSHLEKMADGDIITLPLKGSDFWENAYGTEDHINSGLWGGPSRFDPDEHFATGNSTLVSTAPRGFTAVRRGDRIHVSGTIDHKWRDKNDYQGEGPLAIAAQAAAAWGGAREYDHVSQFSQRLEGELRIENGEIVPVHFRWRHLTHKEQER